MNCTPGLSLTHHPTVVDEYATTLNRDVSWIEKKSSAIGESSDLLSSAWSPDDAKQNKPYHFSLTRYR